MRTYSLTTTTTNPKMNDDQNGEMTTVVKDVVHKVMVHLPDIVPDPLQHEAKDLVLTKTKTTATRTSRQQQSNRCSCWRKRSK